MVATTSTALKSINPFMLKCATLLSVHPLKVDHLFSASKFSVFDLCFEAMSPERAKLNASVVKWLVVALYYLLIIPR